jgi:hypothetical protein
MLHQDGSRFAWLDGQPQLDLIVTMDDATSTIYSGFLVDEEGTASSFRGLLETFTALGLASSLYTDRGSHYFYTPKAGETVDKQRLTQVGRALQRLGIEHIPAYSPEARGRSERMFGTLQERLPKELKLAGITNMEAANRFIAAVYLPAHNARFARPPESAESAFVSADPTQLAEILCVEEERVVARDNTVTWGRLHLQLPQSRVRHHYVKATVKVRQYPDGALAIFHGPRCIGRYDARGGEIGEPTPTMLHPCSTPSRRGLEASRPAPPAARRPALTASRHGIGPL